LTGRPSTPRHLGPITESSGILDHPLSRVTTAWKRFQQDIIGEFV
jgi:hypothetical protein